MLGITLPLSAQRKIESDTVVRFEGRYDIAPTFEGGNEALHDFIADKIHYFKNGIGGNVYVSFTIDTNGAVTGPVAITDPGRGSAEEAVRVVELLPQWRPATLNGHAVAVRCTLSVFFDIEKNHIQTPYWQEPQYKQDPLNPTRQVEVEGWQFHGR